MNISTWMNNMLLQQTLDLSIKSQRTFESFICQTNMEAKRMLEFYIKNPSDTMIILKGDTGTGKTHLLHAACHLYQQSGRHASYIPMRNPADIESLLTRPLSGELVCIDDVSNASTHDDLEHLLFRLYNHAELAGCKLIWSMNKKQEFARKDLKSRQQAMLAIELIPYSLEEVHQIIMQYIHHAQSQITEDACKLLTKNYTRSIPKLISKIKEIEAHACSVQRKVTLKMVRDLISSDLHQLD